MIVLPAKQVTLHAFLCVVMKSEVPDFCQKVKSNKTRNLKKKKSIPPYISQRSVGSEFRHKGHINYASLALGSRESYKKLKTEYFWNPVSSMLATTLHYSVILVPSRVGSRDSEKRAGGGGRGIGKLSPGLRTCAFYIYKKSLWKNGRGGALFKQTRVDCIFPYRSCFV